MDAVATNLYHALIDALHARGDTDTADRPVTVAEIYQELIPYRGVREALGFELNAEYEHALLRLLAGEAELLRLEPTSARDELRQELQSPNPYVGLYRKFAACDVWVKVDPREQDATPSPKPAPAAERPAAATAPPPATPVTPAVPATAIPPTAPPIFSAPATAPARTISGRLGEPVGSLAGGSTAGPAGASIGEPARPLVSAPASTSNPASAPAAGTSGEQALATCPFCQKAVPTGRKVKYCPNCGGDQRSRPCARCGEVLDNAWRYCISCGAAAATSTSAPA